MSGGGGRQREAGRGEVGIRGLPIASNLVKQKCYFLILALLILLFLYLAVQRHLALWTAGQGASALPRAGEDMFIVGNCKLADLYQHDFMD